MYTRCVFQISSSLSAGEVNGNENGISRVTMPLDILVDDVLPLVSQRSTLSSLMQTCTVLYQYGVPYLGQELAFHGKPASLDGLFSFWRFFNKSPDRRPSRLLRKLIIPEFAPIFRPEDQNSEMLLVLDQIVEAAPSLEILEVARVREMMSLEDIAAPFVMAITAHQNLKTISFSDVDLFNRAMLRLMRSPVVTVKLSFDEVVDLPSAVPDEAHPTLQYSCPPSSPPYRNWICRGRLLIWRPFQWLAYSIRMSIHSGHTRNGRSTSLSRTWCTSVQISRT